jgi:hypothetical protein
METVAEDNRGFVEQRSCFAALALIGIQGHRMFNSSHSLENRPLFARKIALVCDRFEPKSQLTALANELGCHLIDGDWTLQASQNGDVEPSIDLLVVDLTSISDRPWEELIHIASYLNRSSAEALVWTDLEQLDTAFAALPIEQCHFLVDATDAEMLLIMSGVIRRGRMEQLHDKSRDSEVGALHRISDELAGFARALAKIAELDEPIPPAMNDRPVSFRPAPMAALQPLIGMPAVSETKRSDLPVTARYLRDVIKTRRMREHYFDASLFADPAWDILLDLLAARLEDKQVSVSSLCIAAAVPSTTALRWLTGMTDNGILERRHDPNDARRVFIALSDEVAANLISYFDDVRQENSMPI